MAVAQPLKAPVTAVFHNILLATDFSDPSRRAFAEALALAIHDAARISLVHVIPRNPQCLPFDSPPELDLDRIAAEKQMNSFIKSMPSEHVVDETFLIHGDAPEIIASLIENKDIDLLVIGTRGRGGIQKLALGSVAEQLLRLASCPVLTIGPKVTPIPNSPFAFQRILFATDFGKAAAKALPLALALAQAHKAKLTLLHLLPAMPATTGTLSAFSPAPAAADELVEWETAARKESLRTLKESIPQGTELEQEPEFLTAIEFLPEGILLAAAEMDLIVMGANRALSPRAAAHFPWSLVHEVVRDAPCPVLTVRD